MNLLKEHDHKLYEELCINTKPTLFKLKSYAKDLFKIEYLKIRNFDEVHPISEIRADSLEEMVNVKGMVTKATKVVAYVEGSKWECLSCGTAISTQRDDKPSRCSCGNIKKFNLISTDLRDLQEIEIEEPQDELEGKQPQKIRIRLFDELTDKKLSGILQPGNKISVLGILEKSETKKKIEETLFEYRILGLGIEPLDEQFYDEKLSDEDMRVIQEISVDNPLFKLANSLSPSI